MSGPSRTVSEPCVRLQIRLPVPLAESLRALANDTGHSRPSIITSVLRRALGADLDSDGEGLNALATAAAGWRDWCGSAIKERGPAAEVYAALVADLEVLRLSALIGGEIVAGDVSSDLSALLLDRSREAELEPVKVFRVVAERQLTLSRLLEDLARCGDGELERLSRILAKDLGKAELLARAGLGLAESPDCPRRRQAVRDALEATPETRVLALVGAGLGSQP